MTDKNKIQLLLEDEELQTLMVGYANYCMKERGVLRNPVTFKQWLNAPQGLISQLENISVNWQPNSVIKTKAIEIGKLYLSTLNNEIDKIKIEIEEEFNDSNRLGELIDKIKMKLR